MINNRDIRFMGGLLGCSALDQFVDLRLGPCKWVVTVLTQSHTGAAFRIPLYARSI
jgi:hypothetical protein